MAMVNSKTAKGGYPHLAKSQARIQAQIPLPHELLHNSAPEAKEQLAIIVETTPAGRPLSDLARRLSSRDLRLIFPLLAEPGIDGQPDYLAKLLLLVRERACPSLYRYGWAVFQQQYPQPAVARGLADLANVLAIKQKSDPRQYTGLPMISELADPAAKNLPDLLFKIIDKEQINWPDFVSHYEIDLCLPFGSALLSRFFLKSRSSLPRVDKSQFRRILQHTKSGQLPTLLRRILTDDQLPAQSLNEYYQVIYQSFGAPDEGHPVWQEMRRREKTNFQQWILAATIGSHCQGNKAKTRFYFRYASLVEATEQWDENTLVIYFPGFCIVDDKRQAQFSVYYATNTNHPQQQPDYYAAKGISPGGLSVPHRRVEDAVKRASTTGPVGLLLDEAGIQTSASFIDFCLAKNGAVSRSELKNLQSI